MLTNPKKAERGTITRTGASAPAYIGTRNTGLVNKPSLVKDCIFGPRSTLRPVVTFRGQDSVIHRASSNGSNRPAASALGSTSALFWDAKPLCFGWSVEYFLAMVVVSPTTESAFPRLTIAVFYDTL